MLLAGGFTVNWRWMFGIHCFRSEPTHCH